MQLPLAELLQDLPLETAQMARDFQAFVRAKNVKTPTQLVRMVLVYCGLDTTLREVAGTWTALYEPITDQSVAERLRACRPWVHALLGFPIGMAKLWNMFHNFAKDAGKRTQL